MGVQRAHFAIVSHRACFSRSVYPEHMSLMSHTYTSFSPEQMASTFNQHQQCVPCHAHAQAPSSPTEASFQVMAAIKLSSGVVLFSTPEFQSMARLIGQENQTLGLWHLQKMFCQNLPQGTRCMYETITVGRERVDLMSVTKLGDDTLLWMVSLDRRCQNMRHMGGWKDRHQMSETDRPRMILLKIRAEEVEQQIELYPLLDMWIPRQK